MRKVLVTGGAGFIGSHLVDQLLEGGAVVRVLDNLSTGSLTNLQAAAESNSRANGAFNGGRLEVMVGDIRDRELLRKALRGVKYVFHMAALPASAASMTDPGEIHAVNVEGTLNLLHGALTEGVWRVVVASCASVYGPPGSVPISEDAPLRPTSLFAASKVAAETYCRAFHARHQLDTVTLRYFTVYGPRQKAGPTGGLVPALIEALRQGRGFIDQGDRCSEEFMFVKDAVAATLAAARAPRATGRVINVGSGKLATIDDVLTMLGGLLGTPVISGPPRNPEAHTDPSSAGMCLAEELLDFTPRVPLISGLAEVVRWLGEAEQSARYALAPVGMEE